MRTSRIGARSKHSVRVGRVSLDRSFDISTFSDLGVGAPLQACLDALRINDPRPIQAATIPPALQGKDVCGKAPTGSGKTLAFGVPMVQNLTKSRPRRPVALVLVPTRELATQVHDVLGTLLGREANRVVSVFGGTGYRDQIRALHKGVNIVVACPGRLEDLIERGDILLDDVRTVVLDEADRMSDMGFLPAVRRLLDQTAPNRQMLLFSATIGKEVESIIRNYLHDPVRVNIEADAREKADVTHHFWKVDRNERVQILAQLIERHGSAFVFCRTKHGADRVVRQLQQHGVRAVPMHGDRTQGQRERALDSFVKGRADALVATDVVARGIHVDDLPVVVHFDPPADHTDYVHRSGRTGRAGSTGTVVSLVTDETQKAISGMQKALGFQPGSQAPFSTPMVTAPSRPALSESVDAPQVTHNPAPAPRQKQSPASRQRSAPAPRQRTGPAARSRSAGGAQRGTVKFFNGDRGYGFVARDSGADLFVHHSNIEGAPQHGLAEGQTVEFTIAAGRRGDEARQVRVVQAAGGEPPGPLAPGDDGDAGAQRQVQPERQGRGTGGPLQGDERDADDGGQHVGDEEALEQGDRADPGQAEANDGGEAHVAKSHPSRVEQIHHQEDGEEDEAAECGVLEPHPLVVGGGDRQAGHHHGGPDAVDQRLGQQPAGKVAVGQLDQPQQEEQWWEGVERPPHLVEHNPRQQA